MISKAVYKKFVYVAYAFFILLAITWFGINFYNGQHINVIAIGVAAIFGVQIYHMNRIVNLILGIILLPVSLYMLLQFLSIGLRNPNGFDVFDSSMSTLSFASFIFSAILMFSYLKLSFERE